MPFFFISVCLLAQSSSVLEKRIDIEIDNIPLSEALTQISQEAGFDFAYSANLLPKDRPTTFQAKEKKVESVLNEIILDEGVQYKIIQNLVVIYRPKTPKNRFIENTVSGVVSDGKTGRPISGATIYDPYLQLSATTNSQGYYQLSIPNPDFRLELAVQYPNYQPKKVKVRLDNNKTLNIRLHPYAQEFTLQPIDIEVTQEEGDDPLPSQKIEISRISSPSSMLKPISEAKVMSALLPEKVRNPPMDSIPSLDAKPFQVSFFPPASTSLLQSGKRINSFSLNVLAGYSAGLEGIEVGGIMNIERFNVKGIQVAGFGNVVAGKMHGIQVAGFINTSKLKVEGFQIAGFNNFAGLDVKGTQISGFNNISKGTLKGLQITGFNNVLVKGGRGIQAAGFMNTSGDTLNGIQAAGFINVVRKRFKGVQVAGFSNLTGDLEGVQVSGFMNRAKKVRGLQLGFLNFADSIEKGISLGFLSFVKNGYRTLEIMGDELGFVNVSFKTGVSRFYNIISAGITPQPEQRSWQFGYGIGSMFYVGKKQKFSFNFDLSSHYINEEKVWREEFNLNNQLKVQIGYKLSPKITAFIGASANYLISELTNEQGELVPSTLPNYHFYQRQGDQAIHTAWVGFHGGIRFF